VWLGVTDRNGQPMKEPPRPLLAQGFVRYVGEAVAMVVAETRDQARDAAEAIAVDYAALPDVAAAALAASAPRVHDGFDDNLCYDWTIGDAAPVGEAFAGLRRSLASRSSTTG
jgi:aerobic carbon-monoxide dehydrogenase large subunit